MSIGDGDDRRLFPSRHNSELASVILRIKNNDPAITRLELRRVDYLSGRAWRRLGDIVGQNEYLEELVISNSARNTAEIFTGLQNNKSIQMFNFHSFDLWGSEKLLYLSPFLSNTPSLRKIILQRCGLGIASINVLSSALLNRSEHTLETLFLSRNDLSDVDLDMLVQALSRSRNLINLFLDECCIGLSGCTSLAMLLLHPESNLASVHLQGNAIDDKCAVILASSLAKNTKIRKLNLYKNHGITSLGWSSFQNTVCNSSSIIDIMESNHKLHHLIPWSDQPTKELLMRTLGVDDANLLRASLTTGGNRDKTVVARRKMIWSHARGNVSLGDSSIETPVMPRILAWFGNESDGTNAHLVQYHDPPLPTARITTIRLDSFYRVIRSRPGLCNANENALAQT